MYHVSAQGVDERMMIKCTLMSVVSPPVFDSGIWFAVWRHNISIKEEPEKRKTQRLRKGGNCMPPQKNVFLYVTSTGNSHREKKRKEKNDTTLAGYDRLGFDVCVDGYRQKWHPLTSSLLYVFKEKALFFVFTFLKFRSPMRKMYVRQLKSR